MPVRLLLSAIASVRPLSLGRPRRWYFDSIGIARGSRCAVFIAGCPGAFGMVLGDFLCAEPVPPCSALELRFRLDDIVITEGEVQK